MKHKIFAFFIMGFFLWACGKEVTPREDPIATSPNDKKSVTLMVWGAFWCSDCSSKLPKVQSQLKSRLGKDFKNVKFQLWVPTGMTPNQKPTKEIAELYLTKLGLEAEANIDPWRWKTFRKYLKGVKLALPAGILLNEKNEIIKKFPPGPTSFFPEDIAASVDESLK